MVILLLPELQIIVLKSLYKYLKDNMVTVQLAMVIIVHYASNSYLFIEIGLYLKSHDLIMAVCLHKIQNYRIWT
jgi:hypothetical protein